MSTFLFFVASLFLHSQTHAAPTLDPKYGKAVRLCQKVNPAKHVWLFKQWHLGTATNTRSASDFRKYPQQGNQTAIFSQLDDWIAKEQIRQVVAEGCSGEMDASSTMRWNGWTLQDLMSELKDERYPEILTSVPLKLEAKHGPAVLTTCGDDEKLLKENLLAFSDARGALGFLKRIVQYQKDPKKAKTYIDGVIQTYNMSKRTTSEQAIGRLKSELQSTVARIEKGIDQRNEKVMTIIRASTESEIAVVFGGMHADGIRQKLEKDGIACTVVEPVGYQEDETALVESLKRVLEKI